MNNFQNQISWLLEGDPSIRFQTKKDLLHISGSELISEQQKILTEGWGKRLMDKQEDNGRWENALYSPKFRSTFYSLLLLKNLRAPVSAKINKAINLILDKGFYNDHGINLWPSWNRSETCVSGMFLTIMSHFALDDKRTQKMSEFLLKEQMKDGGWNCRAHKGATHASFHTTMSVMEGLWEFQKKQGGKSERIETALAKGLEFLLQHRLYRSHRTGKIVDYKMTKMIFPPQWQFDFMRFLDYAQEKKIAKDERLNEAIELIFSKQTPEGCWNQEILHSGRMHFSMESIGKASRWNTLRAIRVLNWWN